MRGGLHARADHPPFVDRLADRDVVEVRRADVSDRCESGEQRVPNGTDGQDGAEGIDVADGRVIAGGVA